MNVGNWIRRNGSTILTCFGAGGMIATVILAVKATPKAMRACTEAQVEKGRNHLTKLEIVRAVAPAYIPAAATGIGTLACIFGANTLSRRQQAAMASAYAALASAFEGYRQKVDDICGPGTDAMIEKVIAQEKHDEEDDRPPWDEVQTFYLECNGVAPKLFERTMEQIVKAEYEANRIFILKGELTLNEFLQILDLPAVEAGDSIGWEAYIGETQYGYRWIDFSHRYFAMEDMTVCSIDMPFEAHSLFEEEYDWHMSHLQEIADEGRQQP